MNDAVQLTLVTYCDDLTDPKAEVTPFGIIGETKDIRFFVLALPIVHDMFAMEMLQGLPMLLQEKLAEKRFEADLRGSINTQPFDVPDLIPVEKDDYFTGRWWTQAHVLFKRHVPKAPHTHLITYSVMRTVTDEPASAPMQH